MDEEITAEEAGQVKKLLEQNLRLTQEIYVMTKKINGYLAFQRLVSIFYLIMIVAPIILGIIYLPPLLNGLFDQYKDALGIQGGSSSMIQGLLNGGAGKLDLNSLDADKIKSLLNK
jgi:hypothetical protein